MMGGANLTKKTTVTANKGTNEGQMKGRVALAACKRKSRAVKATRGENSPSVDM